MTGRRPLSGAGAGRPGPGRCRPRARRRAARSVPHRARAAVPRHAVRRGRRVSPQQLQPPGIDPVRIPAGLRHEELQPLHRRMLRSRDRLGPGQRGQRLIPVPRRQQPGQVLPESPPLR
jgi:hypothetical protein